MRNRIFVETSVLVSASIYAASENNPVKLKHQFFDECMQLFGLIRKHKNKRLGISTLVVQDEANAVLEKAITRHLEYEKYPRENWFNILSFLLGTCGDRMRELSGDLQWEPVDENEVLRFSQKIRDVYLGLRKTALDVDAKWIATSKTRGVPKPLRRVASPIYLEQEKKDNVQLVSLLRGFPSDTDIRILAEAAHLNRNYKETGMEASMYLASCDTLLSPKRLKDGTYSSKVTDKVLSEFGVHCAWPRQITDMLGNL